MDKYTKKLLIYTSTLGSGIYFIVFVFTLIFFVQPFAKLLFLTYGFLVGLAKIFIMFYGIKKYLLDADRPNPLTVGLIAFLFILSWALLGIGCYFSINNSITHFILLLVGYGISLIALIGYCMIPFMHKND